MVDRHSIYRGRIHHARPAPKHAFSYPISYLCCDIDDLDALAGRWRGFAVERCNAVHWRRRDFWPDQPGALRAAIESTLATQSIDASGQILQLTRPASFGRCFNPVSFYFVHDGARRPTAIVAEITNTPWGERQRYVLKLNGQPPWQFAFAKAFHVSPFINLQQQYDWSFTAPGDTLKIMMKAHQHQTVTFVAHLKLRRVPLSAKSLRHYAVGALAGNLAVSVRIYWQALRLWLAGARHLDHPHNQPPPTIAIDAT